MLYYLGKGTEFKKEECKEYKTIEGALRAAAKDKEFVVWDENGQVIGSLTDNVPEGALQTNADGSVPTFDENGNPAGNVDAVTVAAVTGNTDTDERQGGDEQKTPHDDADGQRDDLNNGEETNTPSGQDNGENGANTKSDEENDAVIVPQGKMKVTVICDGSLNLRRSPKWGNDNICGRATRGQSYYVKEIYKVDGKKMVRTIGDLYLSGESEHVQFEQL